MLLANPFTGVVLNANPNGDNQYSNPDGPSVPRTKISKKRAMTIASLADLRGHQGLVAKLKANEEQMGIGQIYSQEDYDFAKWLETNMPAKRNPGHLQWIDEALRKYG